MTRLAITLALGILILPATGCLLGPDFESPEVEMSAAWRDESQGPFNRQPVTQIEWWKQFNDPVLNQLVEQAIANNHDLETAALNVVQARAGRVVGILNFFPLIMGKASAAHVNFSETVKPNIDVDIPELGPIAQAVIARAPKIEVTTSDNLNMYSAGLDAIWELDLWGSKRRNYEALVAEIQAAYAGYDDVLVSVIAEVAINYIEIRAADSRIAALRSVVAQQQHFFEITQARFEAKKAPETDVLLAQTLTGISESGVPALENTRRLSENALCILLGIAPQDLSALLGEGDIPMPPASVATGIPADLLRRRPDVRRAEHQAHAQCARIGISKAEILPSFSLIGSIGYSSTDSDRLFDRESIGGAYGGTVSITKLINYPGFVQKVRMEDARFEQAMLAYEQAVLRASQEAENAMFSFLKTREQIEILTPSVQAAERASDLAVGAYNQGQVIVSVPLVALSIYGGQQDKVLAQRAAAAMQIVALNKALGGGWELRQHDELVPEATRERMKSRSDWWSFGGRHALRTHRGEPSGRTSGSSARRQPVETRRIEPGSNVQSHVD